MRGRGRGRGRGRKGHAITEAGDSRTYRVGGREPELEAVNLILVEGILIENPYVEEPFLKVVGRHQLDSGREVVVQLDMAWGSVSLTELLMGPGSSKRMTDGARMEGQTLDPRTGQKGGSPCRAPCLSVLQRRSSWPVLCALRWRREWLEWVIRVAGAVGRGCSSWRRACSGLSGRDGTRQARERCVWLADAAAELKVGVGNTVHAPSAYIRNDTGQAALWSGASQLLFALSPSIQRPCLYIFSVPQCMYPLLGWVTPSGCRVHC